MVWFQCEDCGENLKKPKLSNRFRICSASKLSCIDCGVIFEQQTVQGRAQCITEAEKYGPKGQVKTPNGSNAKPNKRTKEKPNINKVISTSSLVFLCNTKAISQQTLLLHAEGKKHRAKARAFHAKQQPEQMEASALDTKALTENKVNIESLENKPKGEAKPQDLPKDGHVQINSEASNGDIPSNKKRKLDVPVRDITEIQSVDDSSGKACNVVREDKAAFITDKEDNKRKIMWKKLIKAALKSVFLKMRKLQKLVLKALQESGVGDKSQLSEMLEHKIISYSRYTVENKYVHLVAKDRL
ncbi:hypothetical protein PVK06_013761 [Gossypium arboreum]|uniref:UBP1-associated proteins 1C n=1 Tax=Gossypium arboreum TaxID=29729 RepID=A0ABR0PT63_GOSAR|nr:hypothetical protein PVK06_013761 [Gossypium arboreum]